MERHFYSIGVSMDLPTVPARARSQVSAPTKAKPRPEWQDPFISPAQEPIPVVDVEPMEALELVKV
eukprot:3644107-Amphidinium_carterae.1